REHDVVVIGGGTAPSPPGWIVNITLLGDAAVKPIMRATAKVGDAIAVTGAVGRSAGGAARLAAPTAPAAGDHAPRLGVSAAHRRPRPRTREGQWLAAAGGVTAMIDLSDGLATDLGHLCEESAVGARVELARLPVSPAVNPVAKALDRDALAWATGGGEDYELLLTCEPGVFDRLASGLAAATGTRLTVVGEMTDAADGIRYLDAGGSAVPVRSGFEHFVTGRARV